VISQLVNACEVEDRKSEGRKGKQPRSRSGSGPNPVQKVREPDRGQSTVIVYKARYPDILLIPIEECISAVYI
jgi:hypothetical protein